MENDDGGRRITKRQKILKLIANSKLSAKELEAIFRSASPRDKTSALFAISPCETNESNFALRYGMITITKKMPAYDRFRSIETPEETLQMISDLVEMDVSRATDSQGFDAGEHNAYIVDRLIRDIGQFTRPRPKQEELLTYQCPASITTLTAEGKEAGSDDGKKADLVVEYAAPVHLHAEKKEVSEELELVNDQADILVLNQRSSEASPRQHADWKLYVYKNRHTRLGLQLKVVDDIKTVANIADLFQAAMYGIQDLMATAGYPKAFRPPVYLLAHDSHSWFYGILELDAFVKVKGGQIDPVSLEGFPESLEPVNGKKFTPCMTRSEVLAAFELWKKKMAWADMDVPDGVHPVGRLFLRYERYGFPSLYGKQPLTDGRRRYFDGMLKILVGRRATKWSPEEAHCAWKLRKALKRDWW